MADEAYPPSDLENEHVLDRIKKNDPKITYMMFDFTYSDGFGGQAPHYFATSVDWDKEQWSFFENSHLACVTIDISIFDNKRKKSKNATAKDRENIRSFAKALARNRSIKEIMFDVSDYLGDECIIGDIFKLLSPMFGRLHKFEIINTDLDDNSVQKLKMAIESCGGESEVQEIELGSNDITSQQAAIIIDAINGHWKKLKKIKWESDNGEGLFGTSPGVIALGNLVSNPSSVLEELDLGRDDWRRNTAEELEGTSAFATALSNNEKLKVVNLGCTVMFSERELQTVSSILRHNSIEDLQLYGQQIGVEGMNGIAQGLTNNTSLTELNLNECGVVTSAGWASLSDAIKNNPGLPLERLYISPFIMTDSVTTSIASILTDNGSLKELTLGGRWDKRDEVLTELSNALANNTSLTWLDLGSTDRATSRRIKDDQSAGLKVLSRILCNNSSIDATFRSNHTLRMVSMIVPDDSYRSVDLPSHLADMLRLNRNNNNNKFEASRQKILRCHFDGYQTQEFVDMDLEVLPNALAWCGKDYRGPTLLYHLIQSQPSLFDSSRASKTGATKRKRNGRDDTGLGQGEKQNCVVS